MLTNLFLSFFGKIKMEDNEQYMLLTYRSHIHKVVASTYYQSDAGWGCMIRVGQMGIANLLLKSEKLPLKSIIPLFWDNAEMPFSIQILTGIAPKIYPNKKPFEWFSPCQIGFVMKEALEHFSQDFRVNISNDNSMFLSDILIDRKKIVLILMCRIGLDEPGPTQLANVIDFMKSKYFFAILGGTPKYAHLFLKVKGDYLGYLDPHKTLKAAESEEELLKNEEQYIGKLQWIKKQKIDCSMGIMFSFRREELEEFWCEMEGIKSKSKDGFYLYMEKVRPDVNMDEDGIIEIFDDDT